MVTTPLDVLKVHPVRKSKKQKELFREDISSYFCANGYSVSIEEGLFGARNIVVGSPNSAQYVVTAHYDTPAGMLFPNLITPCNLSLFLLWQITVVLLIFVPTLLIGLLAGYLTHNLEVGRMVFEVLILITTVLMLFGSANKNNYNDNTSGVVLVLEMARKLPERLRGKVCFVLFDLEEAGLIGSYSYSRSHKGPTKHQIILNADCVGDGDHIMLFPSKKTRKSKAMMRWLKLCNRRVEAKEICLRESGFSFFPSDQANFPYGVGITALHKAKNGWFYCSRAHTSRDTVLEWKNIEVLSDCLIQMVSAIR